MAGLGNQVGYALLGGVLPALVWLYFWLREDIHPEPKRLIVKAFAVGILAIPFALAAEALWYCAGAFFFLTPHEATFCTAGSPFFGPLPGVSTAFSILGFAAIEEYVKYRSAKRFLFTSKDFDEPVDAMIYLITVALGFAAFENFFFLFSAFGESFFEGLVVGNLRFIGATLLHAVSSGAVGYALALTFYRPERRAAYTFIGLLAATTIHTAFNAVVLSTDSTGLGIWQALSVLVLTGIVLIFAFDRAKKIKQQSFYAKR